MVQRLATHLLPAAVVAALVAMPARTAPAAQDPAGPFATLAQALVAQIREARDMDGGFFGGDTDAGPRLAVWPYEARDLPVNAATARGWNERLLAALRDADGSAPFTFVERRDLAKVARDAAVTGGLQGVENPTAFAADNAAADVLIIGRPRIRDGTVHLAYKAVEVDGAQIAMTPPAAVGPVPAQSGGGAVTLRAAVQRAARHFTERLPAMRTMQANALTVGATGRTSPLARYITERLATAIQEASTSELHGTRVSTTTTRGLSRMRSIRPNPREAGASDSGKAPVHQLEGKVWPLGKALGLQVHVTAPDGPTVRWGGRVVRAGLPERLRLRPEAPDVTDTSHGPLGLEITTSRGKNPTYAVGERMVLGIRTREAAHVYCFARDVEGTVVKLLPNPYSPNLATTEGQYHEIGGPKSDFTLDVTRPAGRERLTCYATDRDVTPDLPEAIRSDDVAEVPPDVADRLGDIFRGLDNTRLSRAALTIRVVEKRRALGGGE